MVELTHFDMVQKAWKCWLLSHVWLCNPMDCNPSGSSVRGILQAGILEWVAIPFSRGSSWPRDQTWVSCTVGRFFTIWATKSMVIHKGPWLQGAPSRSQFENREILHLRSWNSFSLHGHCLVHLFKKCFFWFFFYYSGCGVTRPVDSSDPGPYPHWILAE